jgi:hypothetical protein
VRRNALTDLEPPFTTAPADAEAYSTLFNHLGELVDQHGHEPYVQQKGTVARLGGLWHQEVMRSKRVALAVKTGALVTARAVFEPSKRGQYDPLHYQGGKAMQFSMAANVFSSFDNFYNREDEYASLVIDRIADTEGGAACLYVASTGYRRDRPPVYKNDFIPVRTLLIGQGAGMAVLRGYSSTGRWNGEDQPVTPDGARQIHSDITALLSPAENGHPDMQPREPRFNTVPDISAKPWTGTAYGLRAPQVSGWAPIGELGN